MKIRTSFDYPPIPVRSFDWSAVDDDTYEPGNPIGHGATEQEAIADLMAQMDDVDDGQPSEAQEWSDYDPHC